MEVAVVLFEGFNALDAVGPQDALNRMSGVCLTYAAERVGPVTSEGGRLALVADAQLGELPRPDVVVVPGGAGRRRHMANGSLHRWLRMADASSRWTVGVGEGTLLLAAAGPLRERKAASSDGRRRELELLGAVPVLDPIVVDGKYATAANGVAGIELASHLRRWITSRPRVQDLEPPDRVRP